MISLEALNSTKDLIAVLADKGVTLRVRPGTPVAEAMACTDTYMGAIDCLTQIDTLPDSLYQPNAPVKAADGSEICMHSAYQEAAADKLGIVLASHISHATTVVLPAIADLAVALEKALDIEANSGVASYKIEMITGSALLDLTEITSAIDEYATISPKRELPFVLDFKPMSDEEIVGLMKVGADAYDNAILQFVSQATMPVVREVWETVFAGNPAGVENYDIFRSDTKLAEYRNFTTFLIASRLMLDKDKLPEVTGAARMSSAKYPMALRALLEVSGTALYSLLSRMRAREKSGLLIERIEGKRVFVNKAVYDRFMADGGDIETILGAAITSGAQTTVDQITGNVEKLLEAWSYHVSRNKMSEAGSALITARYAINTFVRQYVASSEDQVIINNRKLILTQLDDYLKSVYSVALGDIHCLATQAVCRILFNHTDAEQLLCGVTEAMQSNPDISKEDALNLAVTDYVANWFVSQIEIG